MSRAALREACALAEERAGALGIALALLGCARVATAHPPYEGEDRVVVDTVGRSLRLVRSYIDGIFGSDPVKLVVRDSDDRTVTETEYGRELAALCWRARPCLVFRYDGVLDVLPTNVWRLDNGTLHETRSAGLRALGAVMPLWENAGGYVVCFVFLAIPFLFLWLVGRWTSRYRALLSALVVAVTLPYLFIWLYAVVVLSRLSLPLVAVVCAGGAAALTMGWRATRRAGVSPSKLTTHSRTRASAIKSSSGSPRRARSTCTCGEQWAPAG